MTGGVERLAENVRMVRERIAEAAQRSGRSVAAVRLIAVTKYVDVQLTQAMAAAGCLDLGESRPQQLWQKAEALASWPIVWHLIGHLQSNKVRRTLGAAHWLHSIDSWDLLQVADQAATALQRTPRVLLEVNISGDASKHGFQPQELLQKSWSLDVWQSVKVAGLMGMSGLHADASATRRQFAELRELRDRLVREKPEVGDLAELSMGMSDDFEIAIEEGATMVRVGSALFEGVSSNDPG